MALPHLLPALMVARTVSLVLIQTRCTQFYMTENLAASSGALAMLPASSEALHLSGNHEILPVDLVMFSPCSEAVKKPQNLVAFLATAAMVPASPGEMYLPESLVPFALTLAMFLTPETSHTPWNLSGLSVSLVMFARTP